MVPSPAVTHVTGGKTDGGHDPAYTLVLCFKSSIRRFVITEKAPTRAFSWLKAATTAFNI